MALENGKANDRKQRKGRLLKNFFFKRRKQTGSESKLKPICNNNYDRPWDYSILLTSIKNYRKYRVSMQTRHTNSRSSDIPVQKAKGEIVILKISVLNLLTPNVNYS